MKYRNEALLAAAGVIAITVTAAVSAGAFERETAPPPRPSYSAECAQMQEELMFLKDRISAGLSTMFADVDHQAVLHDQYVARGCERQRQEMLDWDAMYD
jgi:hypothetical protein